MASIVVLLIMAGCAAYLFLKGTFVRAFATLMAALCANVVAFAWFEQLGNLLIKRDMMPNWAPAVCFLLLFVIAFAILQTIVMNLTRQPIDLGVVPERVGRIVIGLFLGLILSGSLLTAAVIAPLSSNYPYQRFDPARPDLKKPGRPLFNPDGFITRWFGIISGGPLSGGKSFAVLHAGFLDQLFLDRLLTEKDVAARADSGTIELPTKAAAWPATDLKDGSGNPLVPQSGSDLIMARVGFTPKLMRAGGSFSTGQLRLLCKPKGDKRNLQGSAVSIYPVGYLKTPGRIQLKGLTDVIKLQSQDFQAGTKYIDFAFYIPADSEPVAVAFKANDIAMAPQLVTADQAPIPVPFFSTVDCASGLAKVTPLTSAKIYGLELASGQQLLEGTMLTVSDQSDWTEMQTQQSIKPAQFEQGKITCAQAELKKPPTDPNHPAPQNRESNLPTMLKTRDGYSLLSLKCNNPAVGSAVTGEQLPTLIDATGAAHKPCGLVAAGKVDADTIYEVDYCPAGITFTKDGAVAKPFPDAFRLAEKAKSIFRLHVLYMVKTGTIIVSVQPAGAQTGATFDGKECFLVN